MKKITTCAAAFCFAAAPLFAGSTPPTPTPIPNAPSTVTVASVPPAVVASVATALNAAAVSGFAGASPAQASAAISVLSEIRGDAGLLAQLGLTAAQIDSLIQQLRDLLS